MEVILEGLAVTPNPQQQQHLVHRHYHHSCAACGEVVPCLSLSDLSDHAPLLCPIDLPSGSDLLRRDSDVVLLISVTVITVIDVVCH